MFSKGSEQVKYWKHHFLQWWNRLKWLYAILSLGILKENFSMGQWLSRFSVHVFSLSACYKYKFLDNTSRDFDSAVGPGFHLPGDSVGVKVGGTTHMEKLYCKLE